MSPCLTLIPKRHILKRHAALHGTKLHRAGGVGDLGACVEQLEDTGDGAEGLLELAEEAGEAHHGAADAAGVEQEGDQVAGAHLAGEHQVAAEPEHAHHRAPRADHPERLEDGADARPPHRGAKGGLHRRAEAPNLVWLAAERLHHAHAGDRLLQHAGGVRQAILHLGGDAADQAPEDHTEHGDGGHQQQGQAAELPGDRDHQGEGADKLHDRLEQTGHAVCDRVLDQGDIVGDAAGDLASAAVVKEGEREALEVAVGLHTQVAHYALANKSEAVGLHEAKDTLHGHHGHQAEHHLIEIEASRLAR